MQERRKYARVNGLVLVNYKIPNLQMEGKSSAFDISVLGLRITVDKRLENGTTLEMEIYLPGSSQPILAKGEVIWAENCKEHFYAGIKFTLIDEKNKTRLIDYTKRKLEQA